MSDSKTVVINGKTFKVIENDTMNDTMNDTLTSNDKEMDARAKEAVRVAIDKAKFCKKPVACYDTKSKKAYLKYANGEIKYVQ